MWRTGRIDELLSECRCIQLHLPARTSQSSPGEDKDQKNDVVFSKLVLGGKLRSALRYLSPRSSGGVLGMSDAADESSDLTVRDVLSNKHPALVTPPEEALLTDVPGPLNQIIFDRITPELIRIISRQMKGSSGLSGLDSDAWSRLLTSYKESSSRLCVALARSARCLCTEELNPDDLEAFTAARLIPLDKKPGVRPIAVGEVHRRIICRAVMRIVEHDVLLATAPLQLCVGVPSACEGAVHAMRRMYGNDETEAILMVDASNAFNSLNRIAALHNVQSLCPPLARVFLNTYGKPIHLVVSGGGEVLSREGTCQGDPLAMAIYAVSTVPLIRRLSDACPDVHQAWYADDDSAAGLVAHLRPYWDTIKAAGPGFGYYPNAAKTVLLVKPQYERKAREAFQGTGVTITCDGSRYLGGAIGEEQFCTSQLQQLVAKWTEELKSLIELAGPQPQSAYAVLTKGLVGKWLYHLRCSPCPDHLLKEMDALISDELLQALFGCGVPETQGARALMELPARCGGIALPILSRMAPIEHSASMHVTQPLVDMIIAPLNRTPPIGSPSQSLVLAPSTSYPADGVVQLISDVIVGVEGIAPTFGDTNSIFQALSAVRARASESRRKKAKRHEVHTKNLLPDLPPHQQMLTTIAAEKGVSTWLTCDPSWLSGSVLKKSDFRDALCIRYGYPLDGLPLHCVCGGSMTTSHALTCPSGGYPSARHNEVRDIICNVLREVLTDVETELRLLPLDGEAEFTLRTANTSPEARLDIRARGFWSRQQDAFFDVRVTRPRSSLLSRPEIFGHLRSQEHQKKRAYCQRVNNVERAAFTPLVFSTFGMAGPETQVFLKSLAAMVCEKNVDLHYSIVINQLRTRIAFSLLRWSVTCFRGCRASYVRRRAGSLVAKCRRIAP